MKRKILMNAIEIRLKRLMGQGKSVIVAIDHGLFDGPIPSMENLPQTAEKINPVIDALLLAPGMIKHCSNVFAGYKKPLTVVRLNWNTVYCFGWNYLKAKSVYSFSPEEALREGMDIALVSLTLLTGCEERDAQNVEVFSKLCNECHRLGIPVIGEYFPTGHAKMTPKQLHEDVKVGSRIVAELGADAIKTFNTHKFQEVTDSCPVPVFGLGAEKLAKQKDALQLAYDEIKAGAGGVVFGRNAIQVADPFKFQQALCDVVRTLKSPDKAVKEYGLE
jgi:DhnA family fructose-bisphosphate aldolase class Ia